MTTAGDFTYPSMEEIIAKEIEREQEEAAIEANEQSEEEQKQAAIEAWKQRVERLTAGRKPVQTTFNG